jgi:hypothetical protein
MKYNIILALTAMLLLFSFCSENENHPIIPNLNVWVAVEDTQSYERLGCLSPPYMTWIDDSTFAHSRDYKPNDTSYKAEYVIRDNDAYQELVNPDYPNYPECELPEMDFSEITILGKYTQVSGYPEPVYIREVTKNDEEKKYIYSITGISQDMSDCPNHSMNWIAIPKIPDDYTVEFKAILKRDY